MNDTKGLILLIPLFLLAFMQPAAALNNRLRDSPSPYLRLHANDRVAWQRWDQAALAQARKEDKLLFVSVGYYACHWCHVMRRESYQDEKIAAFLNKHFIPVKVDRELEPELDARLMRFVNETRGYGGWPLNVFITPQGDPLIGIVYLPRPDFLGFVERLQTQWSTDREALRTMAGEASQSLAESRSADQRRIKGMTPKALVDALVRQSLSIADDIGGGFGEQSKFPMTPALMALLEIEAHTPHPELRAFLILTLERMAGNGLWDHLGGGFFRYTVDPYWQTPHYEKMLYDNAQLARLYLAAGRQYDREDFQAIGLRTLAFMRHDMAASQGAYVASLSALDVHDVEGGYYLWTKEALQAALTKEEWAAVDESWNLMRPAPTEHGYLPIPVFDALEVAVRLDAPVDKIAARLQGAHGKLLRLREKRVLPRDDKRLAGWNGLALSAFAAGAVAGDKQSMAAARALVGFIQTRLWIDGVLHRAVDRKGRPLGEAALADYAYVAAGLADWAKVSGDEQVRRLASGITAKAWTRFYTSGGWQPEPAGLLPPEARLWHIADDVLPSPTAVILDVSWRGLARPSGKLKAWAGHLHTASRLDIAAMQRDPFYFASQIVLRARRVRQEDEQNKREWPLRSEVPNGS